MEATNGCGVDIVLNSVSGELLHATWKCVASSGIMLEIGKRDFVGRGQLAMNKFEENRTFVGVDLSRTTALNRPLVARMMSLTLDLWKQGHIEPIHLITMFDAENIEESLRYLQKGWHMGKVVTKFPEGDTLSLTPTIQKPVFRGEASYLFVGGMGGLGQSIASWMASHGAKNLIFLSRAAGKSDDDQAFIKELNEAGCSVQCFPCDVADPVAVENAIDQASMPIAGVMQMAMVLSDIGVMDMDLKT
jgi:KR domain/Zinc-binding dehydrogenase